MTVCNNIPDPVDYENPFTTPEPINLSDIVAEFKTAGTAVTNFADSVNDAKIKIDYGNDTATPQYKSKNFKFGDNYVTTDFSEKLKNAAQKLKAAEPNTADLPKLPKTEYIKLDKITAEIAELTRIAGDIANNVSQRQSAQQPINISVSPTINLAGSYVFDNRLKDQLTQDITASVANAVTDAVNRGVSLINSYR